MMMMMMMMMMTIMIMIMIMIMTMIMITILIIIMKIVMRTINALLCHFYLPEFLAFISGVIATLLPRSLTPSCCFDWNISTLEKFDPGGLNMVNT